MGKTKKRHMFLKICAALAIFCAALLLLGRYGLSATRYEVSSEKLPEAFNGFRIVQLSDLHGSTFGEGNSRLIVRVADENPDVIVLTGDFLDENCGAEELEDFSALAEALTEIAPTYYVNGNHEWVSKHMGELSDILEAAGVRYLRNEYVAIARGGESIVLAGAEDANGPADMIKPEALAEEIADAYPGKYAVLLGHRNFWAERYPDLAVDLVLSGHAHGGIVRLPALGGVFGTGGELFPDYEAGLYETGSYTLIVSRGLGNSVAVPRFNNTPEIVTVILQNK